MAKWYFWIAYCEEKGIVYHRQISRNQEYSHEHPVKGTKRAVRNWNEKPFEKESGAAFIVQLEKWLEKST